MPYKDPEAHRRNSREYAAKNREHKRAYDKAYYLEHRERKLATKKERYSPEDAKAYRIKTSEHYVAWAKEYRVKNRKRIAAKDKEYRKNNRALLRAKLNERRAKSRERWRAYYKNWCNENPEKARAIQHKKRAAKLACNGTYTVADIQALWKRQGGLCGNPSCCTKLFRSKRETYQIDHIMPLSRAGTNTGHNLQLLCPKCNRSKKDKDEFEWAQSNGMLFVK